MLVVDYQSGISQVLLSQEKMKSMAPAHVPVAAPLRVSKPGGGAPSVPGGSEIPKAFGLQKGGKKNLDLSKFQIDQH